MIYNQKINKNQPKSIIILLMYKMIKKILDNVDRPAQPWWAKKVKII
jgi:hypothetical protein